MTFANLLTGGEFRFEHDEEVLAFVLGCMLFPQSPVKQYEFVKLVHANHLNQIANDGSELAKDYSLTQYIEAGKIIRAKQGLFGEAHTSVSIRGTGEELFCGHIAADMIIVPLIGFLQGKAINKEVIYRNYALPKNKRNIQNIWKEFKSVAHFWAARELLGDIPTGTAELWPFLDLSEALRTWGSKTEVSKGKGPILDDETVYSFAYSEKNSTNPCAIIQFLEVPHRDRARPFGLEPFSGQVGFWMDGTIQLYPDRA